MVHAQCRMAAIIGAILLLSSGATATQAPAAATTAVPPLSLSASCTGEGQAATLQVRIDNRSDRDTALVLGKLVGAEQTRVIDSLVVMAIRLATGANEDFAFINPKHAMLTGRSTAWIVPIRAGETFALDAPLQYFISRLTYALLDPLTIPGTRLLLEARPSGAAKVWTGTLEATIDPCP